MENSYHQMREAARQEVEHIRQQAGNNQKALQDHVLERLQQLQHEKQTVEMREQQNTEQAKQWCEQIQQQADVRIAQMAESNRQLRLEIHEVQKAAEGQVAYVARQAELDRDRAVKELQMLGAKLEAAHQQLKNSERVASMAGSISGSPCVGNPFDHPLPHTQSAQHTEIISVGPGASECRQHQPLRGDVLFMLRFTKCGWKTIMLEMFYIVQCSSCQQWRGPESLAGRSHWCSKFAPIRVVQVPRSWSCERVYRACGCWHCPGIPLGWKRVYRCANRDLGIRGALGGAGVGNGGAPSGIPVEDYCNLVLDGPQIQGGHIIPTANGTAQNDVKSTMGGHIPSNHGAVIDDKAFQPPTDGWLSDGKSEEDVYKLKRLRSVVVTRLPNDATSCREWRAAFLASISRIDLSKTDFLSNGPHMQWRAEGKAFRNSLQTSEDFIMLNKHIAAELIKPEALSTNVELAHEITSWVEGCAARAEGPKGTPPLNLIMSYYETGLDRAVALGQIHLLNLQLEGKGIKELEEFVKKVNYVLHGFKTADSKGLNTLRRITDKVRESSQRSRKRSFDWIWTQIAEELREKRHDMNYENVVKGLRGTPPHQLALPATGEKQTRTSKQKKTAAVAQPVTPGPVTTQSAKKSPCARHTAGLCKFGDRRRYHHTGDPGSDAARKTYSEFLKNNPKGGESSKDSGNQPGKGKKENTKGTKGYQGRFNSPSSCGCSGVHCDNH